MLGNLGTDISEFANCGGPVALGLFGHG